jgi:hypothetical protein
MANKYGLITRTTFSSGSSKYYVQNSSYGVLAKRELTENNIVLFGVFKNDDLVNDSDEAKLPDWVNMAVCYKTLALLYSELGDKVSIGKMNRWEQRYNQELLRARRVKGLYTPKSRQGLRVYGYSAFKRS